MLYEEKFIQVRTAVYTAELETAHKKGINV